jgi:hypothetical protein
VVSRARLPVAWRSVQRESWRATATLWQRRGIRRQTKRGGRELEGGGDVVAQAPFKAVRRSMMVGQVDGDGVTTLVLGGVGCRETKRQAR